MSKPCLDLVVIDDDVRRESIYKEFLEIFNRGEYSEHEIKMHFCSNADLADRTIRGRRGPFVVLLDMILKGWNSNHCNQLEATIERLRIGVMTISGYFSEPDATSSYLRILRRLGNRYLPILHWSSLQVVVETERDRLSRGDDEQSLLVRASLESFAMDLRTVRGWDSFTQRDTDRSILLMHLSDMHFGLSAGARDQHVFRIGAKLRHENLAVDFVCITGDSVSRGHTGGYDDAVSWIKSLPSNNALALDNDQRPNFFDRVLLCPGNHDFKEELAISAYARRSGATASGFEFLPSNGGKQQPLDNTWMYGIAPFLKFHETLTGWRVGHGQFPGYRVVSNYGSQGIHFVELWSEEYRCGDYSTPLDIDWFRRLLAKVINEIDGAAADGDCIVVLTHRLMPGGDDPHAKEIKGSFGALAPRLKVILLCGHFHDDEVAPISKYKGILKIQGGTTAESNRSDTQLAKLGIVELTRNGGLVDGCIVRRVENRDTGWQLANEVDRFVWDRGEWIPARV